MRRARAVQKVGHSPPPVGSFLGVGLPQGTIAIVCPCSINPLPSCVYVPLQTGTLRPVYGDTFSGCLLRGIIFCSHFSDPLLHSPWTLMLEIGCSTLAPMGCEFLPQWSWRVVRDIWLGSHQDLHANTRILLHFSQFMLRRQKRYQPYGPWEHIPSSIWTEEEAPEVDEEEEDTFLCQVCGKRDTSECSTCDLYLCRGCMDEHTCDIDVPE